MLQIIVFVLVSREKVRMVMFSVSEKLFMVGLTLLRVGLVMVTRKKVVILGVTLLGVVLFMLSRVYRGLINVMVTRKKVIHVGLGSTEGGVGHGEQELQGVVKVMVTREEVLGLQKIVSNLHIYID